MQIAADRLRQIAATILAAAGSSEEEAGKVAVRLVDANLTGHDSHGAIRVPQYVGQVQDGHPDRHDLAPRHEAKGEGTRHICR